MFLIIALIGDSFLINLLTFGAAYYHSNNILKAANFLAFGIACLAPIIIAVRMFIFFGSIRYHPLINRLAGVTLGVYLVSDNPTIREWLWNKILFMNKLYFSNPLIIAGYSIIMSLFVFLISALLEYVREIIFNKLFHF